MGKIILYFFLFALYSCNPSKNVLKKISGESFCYTGKYKLDSAILYNSFSNDVLKNNNYEVFQMNQQKMILFPNSMCSIMHDNEYFTNTKIKKFGYYNRGTKWGIYNIENDTLKVIVVDSPGSSSWLGSELGFLILDRKNLKWIYFDNLSGNESSLKNIEEIGRSIFLKGEQVENFQLPDPNKSWIIKRKWFWCNKEDYKKWKKEHKK